MSLQQNSTLVRTTMVLLTTAALALSPVLVADFIRLDDYGHLFENPQLRRMSVAGLAGLWTKSYFNLYIPVTYSAWWALAMIGSLFGELRQDAWLFHAFNLTIHLLNATLVFSVVRLLTRIGRADTAANADPVDNGIALFSALFFALHPVQVESVAWVSELKGELAAMFGLLGLRCHLRGDNRLLVAALFVVAMLSKPSAIVFPGIVFLIDRIVLRKTLADSVITPALYGVPLLILGLVTKRLQPDADQAYIPTAAQRLLVASDALSFYVSKVLIPFHLAVDYGRTPEQVVNHASRWWLGFSAVLSVAGIASVVKALFLTGVRHQADHWRSLIYCGWAIFVVSLAPVSGLISFGFQDLSTVANHYLYIPMLGMSLIVGGILFRFRASSSSLRVAAVPVIVCAALSFHEAGRWRSTEPLFEHTLTVNPNSYLSFFCIGDELMRSGRLDEGIDSLEKSYAINPDYLNTVLTLGMALTRKGEMEKAIQLYNTALAKDPGIIGARAKYVASIHNNLGMLLLRDGHSEMGVAHIRKAVEIFPRSLNAHLNLGNVALGEHRYGDAVAEYETALSLSPGDRGIEQRLDLARRRATQ